MLGLDSLDETLLLLHPYGFLDFNTGVDVVGTEGASFHASSIDSGVNCIDVLSGLLSLTNTLSSILLPLNSWSCGVIVSLDILGDGRSEEEELEGFLSARYIGAGTLSGNVGGGGGGK